MRRPVLVAGDVELARNLPVGSGDAIALIVNVNKQERAAQSVGLEHLDSGCHAGAAAQVAVDGVAQVVVQLHVLSRHRHRRQQCEY